MEKPYKIQKKAVMSGGSYTLIIPKSWIRSQADRLKKKIVDVFDLFIYEKYIEIRPLK